MATMQIFVERRAPDNLFIDGDWKDAAGRRTFPTYNPADGEVIAEVAEASTADIDMAVGAARRAFEDASWRRMDAADRGRILWHLADAIEARSEDLPPFGGTKQSGYGRELGAYALDLYTQIKSVWVDLN